VTVQGSEVWWDPIVILEVDVVTSFSTVSTDYERCRQKRAGLPQVSSRITRTCLWRTFGALFVVSSEKPGAHTTPTSISHASAAVSVPIHGRLCHLLVLHICMCEILAGLRRTSLDTHLLPPPSITRCCKASSAVFCVTVCDYSSSSSCPQLHLHHGQGRQSRREL
jgi:hypothetical protein